MTALEPTEPVKRRRIPKLEEQRKCRAISKPVHGLKYSDHKETQGRFLQVKADTEIDSEEDADEQPEPYRCHHSLWTTLWDEILVRGNVWPEIVQRERMWR